MKRLQSLGAGAGAASWNRTFRPSHLRQRSIAGVDSSPAFTVDATDLSIVTANDAASAAFGYDLEHLIGAPIATLVVAPDELIIRDHIQTVAQHDTRDGNGNGNGNGTFQRSPPRDDRPCRRLSG